MASKIDENSSMLIIEEEGTKRFLFSRYDPSYPYEPYRGRINLLGGAMDIGDCNPYQTMTREIDEEVTDQRVKDGIIRALKPLKDFISVVRRPGKADYVSIDTVFHSCLDNTLFRSIEEQLELGRRVVSEGLLLVVSKDELIAGDPLTAWSTGEIMSDHIGVEIPKTEPNFSIPLRTPVRDTFSDYMRTFEYKRK